MSLLKHLPNFITCLNLIFGCLAIHEIFTGRLELVIYYVIAAGVMDFFDGFAARLLKVTSAIGKDLDSLVDMVSFGLVPSFVMMSMVSQTGARGYWSFAPLCIAAFSALRLAKFNNDSRQTDTFYGLPTPANAFFCCSLPILLQKGILDNFLTDDLFLVLLSIVLSILMVMDVKLLALKFANFGWKGNEARYLILIISVIGLATFQLVALPFIILLYLISSIFVNTLNINK